MKTQNNLRFYYTYWDSQSNKTLDGFIDNVFTTNHRVVINAITERWQKSGYKYGSNIKITHHE